MTTERITGTVEVGQMEKFEIPEIQEDLATTVIRH